jgi:putative transposase
MLTVADDFRRECVALVVDDSLSSIRITRELNQVLEMRGTPGMLVSDNGTDFTSLAMLAWQEERAVEWHCIAPGKPIQKGLIESFNGKLRERTSLRLPAGGKKDH